MRILQVHNRYQLGGGEDAVVASEARLLRSQGDEVETHIVSNDDIRTVGQRISAAVRVGYSRRSRDALLQKIKETKPEVVHVHNTFPLLTPSVYDACIGADVPVVQTLHNYRLGCLSGTLLRDGKICEKCWQGSLYWGTVHGCYRNSHLGSLAVSAAYSFHRSADIWNRKISRFIVMSEFARKKFEAFGLSPEKIAIKSHFVEDPGPRPALPDRHGALFVGRLSHEKGLLPLVEAWNSVDYPLTIVGDGPLIGEIRQRAPANVTLTGQLSPADVRRKMWESELLVVPSIWNEPFGMVIIEAMACGLPILGSTMGAIPELLGDNLGGRLFAANSTSELHKVVVDFLGNQTKLGLSARKHYETNFTPEISYQLLTNIYRSVLLHRTRNEASA